jgi:hypothetical protein
MIDASTVEIIDSEGKMINRKIENKKVEIQDLKSGIYYIRLNNKGRIEQQKFIKL